MSSEQEVTPFRFRGTLGIIGGGNMAKSIIFPLIQKGNKNNNYQMDFKL
jgi:hypothetical protein